MAGEDHPVDARRAPRGAGRPTSASSARPPRSARRRPRPRNPRAGASSSSTCRSANSARRPVTNRIEAGVDPLAVGIHAIAAFRVIRHLIGRPAVDRGGSARSGTRRRGRPGSGRRGRRPRACPSGPAGSRGGRAPARSSEADSPQAVLIQPGARALTRTVGARLRARLRVNAMMAPLVAAKSSPESPSMPGLGLVPAHRDDRAAALRLHPPADRRGKAGSWRRRRRPRAGRAWRRTRAWRPGRSACRPRRSGARRRARPRGSRPPRRSRSPAVAIGQVGHEDVRPPAPFAQDRGATSSAALRRPPVDDHVGPGLGQGQGHGPADPRGRAQHGRSHALQVESRIRSDMAGGDGTGPNRAGPGRDGRVDSSVIHVIPVDFRETSRVRT